MKTVETLQAKISQLNQELKRVKEELDDITTIKPEHIVAGAVFFVPGSGAYVIVSDAVWDSRDEAKRYIFTGLKGANRSYSLDVMTRAQMYNYIIERGYVRKPNLKVVVIDTETGNEVKL